MTKKPCWGAGMRKRARFILTLTYQHDSEGKAARNVMYKKAQYILGHTSCKPFRKE